MKTVAERCGHGETRAQAAKTGLLAPRQAATLSPRGAECADNSLLRGHPCSPGSPLQGAPLRPRPVYSLVQLDGCEAVGQEWTVPALGLGHLVLLASALPVLATAADTPHSGVRTQARPSSSICANPPAGSELSVPQREAEPQHE